MNEKQNLFDEAARTPVIILAGGLGTRLSEETLNLPKPMVPIGGLPIIVHVMDFYSRFGFCHFIICGGYKIEEIKNYFLTLPYVAKNIEVCFSEGMHEVSIKPNKNKSVNRNHWKVAILETGLNSMTGSRVSQAFEYLNENILYENVCLTYADGLTNANIHDELYMHLNHDRLATVLAVHNPSRFGVFDFKENNTVRFVEKPSEYINGGYFILRKGFDNQLPKNDALCVFEKEPMQNLANTDNLICYKHDGFWQCMDTKREKDLLDNLVLQGKAPWLNPIPSEVYKY